jgi:hypothetical protein
MNYIPEEYILDFLAESAGMSAESPLDTLLRLEDMQSSEEDREYIEIYVHDMFLKRQS